jgi:hypothetical protein
VYKRERDSARKQSLERARMKKGRDHSAVQYLPQSC